MVGYSILEGVIEEEAVYRPLNLDRAVEDLLQEFDTKLESCLDKIREKCTPEQKECIALYKTQAIQLRDAATKESFLKLEPSRHYDREILGRAIQNFDALLEGRQNDENNKQLLILARDLGKRAQSKKIETAIWGFVAVGTLVAACVLAIPTGGLSLLALMLTVETGVFAADEMQGSFQASDKQEKLTSFTETGKGFFPDASEGGATPHDHRDEEGHRAEGDGDSKKTN